ncbi:hypothetical protein SUGI_1108280 [Cryptomeria japonica]|nr:hypothetical protein SUGI_1108280 [Cryptomeria japonica]
MREFMEEMVRTSREMNQQWSARRSKSNGAEGSHNANNGVSVNPATKTFKAKFLQKGEDPLEEESQVPPDSDDEMARYHVNYSALSPAICHDITFIEYYDMKTSNGHRRRRYEEQHCRDIQHHLGKITIPTFDGSGSCSAKA